MSQKRRSRPIWAARLICIIVSLIAVLIGLGAPGIGWMLASVNHIAAGFLASTIIGRACFALCFTIAFGHLVFIGPLSDLRMATGMNLASALLFGVVPLTIALLAMLTPCRRLQATES